MTNTSAPVGRTQGQANNDPGGGAGSGVDQEIYNDPAYAVIAMAESWKEGGISNDDEKTTNSDMRDAIEEMASKKVSGVSEWDIGTTYTAPGTSADLVMRKGFQFINISNTGNLGNDPFLNPDLWFKIPSVDSLMDMFFNGKPSSGGLSPLNDRAGSKYLQNCLFGKFRLGGNGDNFYEFYRVALDGTVVTGDTTLETIFDVGGGSEYFNLDLIAPDVLGTRTLIDMGERVSAAQSSGGENDTIGEVLDDRFQGHRFGSSSFYGTFDGSGYSPGSTASSIQRNAYISTPAAALGITTPVTDGTNGTPRFGATTRPKELTVGSSFVVVMKAA